MVEIKDKLQFRLDKVYYPLIQLGASMRTLLHEQCRQFIGALTNYDTADQLKENIIYHAEHKRKSRK